MTAEVCNQLHPELVGANMLTIYPNSELYQEIRKGNWQPEGEKEKEYVMAEPDITVGIKRQNLLFLPDGNLPDGTGLEEILQFGVENGITQILADIPGWEELPEQYKRAGFSKAYFYRCYQKEKSSRKNRRI